MKKTIDEVIYEMLTEYTGIDEGKWYQNRKKTLDDFWNNEPITFEVYNNDVNWTIDLFQYLMNDCEFEIDSLCEKFNEANEKADNWNGRFGISIEALDILKQANAKEVETVNTYNYDSNLSQVLQYTIYDVKDTRYIALQIHNGYDVRGGYTNARLFVSDYLPSERGFGTVKIFGKEYLVDVQSTEIFDESGSLLDIDNLFDERIEEIRYMYASKGLPVPDGIEGLTAEAFDSDIKPFLPFIEAYEAENKDNAEDQLCLDIS